MKNLSLATAFLLISASAFSQVGVGTTTPNSTLDVRGSMAVNYRAFTTSTSAGASDNTLVFTGTSAATLTLPDAATITGRYYWIKNASSNSSPLTIATTSSQTIDGLSSWSITQQNKSLYLFSNGSNWFIATESTPGAATGSAWVYGGNSVPSQQNIGTTSNYALPFITNNTERMRISPTGNVGIGTSSFNGSNPEKLLVDAGATSSFNVISGKGSINNYLQLNIQNNSSGNNASADIVATANNGNETVNYVDLGINSSTYNLASFSITGANDGYLYSTGNDFAIGNATANRVLKFFTGGTLAANERMRIDDDGNVAIGTTTFDGTNPEKLIVDGGTTSVNIIRGVGNRNSIIRNSLKNSNSGTSAGADFRMYNDADNSVVLGINSTTFSGSSIYTGAGDAQLYSSANDFVIGNTVANRNLRFYTGGIATSNERMRINGNGNVAIGTTTFNATNPEKLLVDAGTTTSYNVISGKGSINNYLQLNIQNNSSGNVASSDIVATANNGSETVNFVNLGINGGGNTSTGQLGGANTAYLYSTGNDFVIGNGTNDAELRFFTTTGGNYTERMRIDGATGNIGIGTTSPTAGRRLHVSGGDMRITNNTINLDIQVGTTFAGHTNAQGVAYYEIGGSESHMFGGQVIPDADNMWSCGISSRRWSAIFSANGTVQTSDIRLKKNILPLTYGMNEVMQMQPVSYDWKDNSGHHKIGLIAQDVKKIIPEVVVGDEEKENLGMNYAELVPVLINALKELKTELSQTKKELEELKTKVNSKQ